MAVKGAQAKNELIQIILKTIPNSFISSDKKTIRVRMSENGEPIEIGMALTAKKDLEMGESATTITSESDEILANSTELKSAPVSIEMTDEEINNIKNLMESLGL